MALKKHHCAVRRVTPPSSDLHNFCKLCRETIRRLITRQKSRGIVRLFRSYHIRPCALCNILLTIIRRAWIPRELRQLYLVQKVALTLRCREVRDGSFVVKVSGHSQRSAAHARISDGLPFMNDSKTLGRVGIYFKGSKPAVLPQGKVSPLLNISLIKSWLRECDEHDHSVQDSRESLLYEPGFRVIDCEEYKLVKIYRPCEYLALSYVWGEPSPEWLKMTKKNLPTLCKPGGLLRLPLRLPRTISSAIRLTRKLGKRFLWVDSLCITQGAHDEKDHLIQAMDEVYRNAWLTIAVTAGGNADRPIDGVGRYRRDGLHARYMRVSKHSAIKVVLGQDDMVTHIERGTWVLRAWTYQEHRLSRRMLYLTPSEAFLDCKDMTKCESGRLIQGPAFNARYEPLLSDKGLLTINPEDIFIRAVERYMSRTLKFLEDILNAFAGIYHTIHPDGYRNDDINFTKGIPTACIPSALLWRSEWPGVASTVVNKKLDGLNLPSWSWAVNVGTPITFAFPQRQTTDLEDLTGDLAFVAVEDDINPDQRESETSSGTSTINSVPRKRQTSKTKLVFTAQSVDVRECFGRIFYQKSESVWIVGDLDVDFHMDRVRLLPDELVLLMESPDSKTDLYDHQMFGLGIRHDAECSRRVGLLEIGRRSDWHELVKRAGCRVQTQGFRLG